MGQNKWLQSAHVFVNGGQFIGVPDQDGSFMISGLPSASYVVEVSHPTFVFPPFRVDINSKGKFRARKLNNVQPNKVEAVEYPLIFKAQGRAPYFQKREEWRITDMLMNPMVLMMVLPMVLIFLMPKMMNAADDETKKEMEESMNRLKPPSANNLPDFSETLTSWFGGGSSSQAAKSKKKK
ncbi:EMC7 [Bugula neritina]|uniref:EMC7 n=1 Tax=Bugula neritina TaxID=10212 RepID=A0A7J7KCV5_BUGNE|nr:EMC7 [Bugula neritina]